MSCGCQSRQKLLLLKCATDDAGRRMWSYDIDSYITFLFHVTGEDINFELEINGFLLVEVTLKRTPEWTECYYVRSRDCEFERFLFSRKHSSLFGSIHGSTHSHAQRIWVRVMCVEWRACVCDVKWHKRPWLAHFRLESRFCVTLQSSRLFNTANAQTL